MPPLGIAKQRLADQLGSPATKGEGRQNMLCAYLAGALLVGLLGNALLGAWWLDPVVGLLIAALAVKRGPRGVARRGLLRLRPARRLSPRLWRPTSQSDRYRALGDHGAASEREPQAVTVRFDDDVDLDLLLETVEVERGCCTFFDLAPDVHRRELVVSVADRERVPALRPSPPRWVSASRQGLRARTIAEPACSWTRCVVADLDVDRGRRRRARRGTRPRSARRRCSRSTAACRRGSRRPCPRRRSRRRRRSARRAAARARPRRAPRACRPERLITQLEMTTSTEASGSGMSSM